MPKHFITTEEFSHLNSTSLFLVDHFKCRQALIDAKMEDARTFLSARTLNIDALAEEVGDKFVSAFIRASKPAMSCCEAG
jgi:AraC-like DNA-binding protein